MSSEIIAPRYLGDGVYASFDGFQIWLSVNDHRNKVVALDPEVMANLIEYSLRLAAAIRKAMDADMEKAADDFIGDVTKVEDDDIIAQFPNLNPSKLL
jgi:hypothetical protein